jgi:hypothetical protein
LLELAIRAKLSQHAKHRCSLIWKWGNKEERQWVAYFSSCILGDGPLVTVGGPQSQALSLLYPQGLKAPSRLGYNVMELAITVPHSLVRYNEAGPIRELRRG